MNRHEVVKELLHILNLSNKFKHALDNRLTVYQEIRYRLNKGQQCQELLESIGQ